MSIRPHRWRPATAVIVALLVLAVAAGCGQERCRVWGIADYAPTKDNPQPTARVFFNDP